MDFQDKLITGFVIITITGIAFGFYQNLQLNKELDSVIKQNNIMVIDYDNYIKTLSIDKSGIKDGLQTFRDYSRTDGLYWVGEDFYCIWAKENTLERQEQIKMHEHCHFLVDNDYKHFCMDYTMEDRFYKIKSELNE